MINLKKLIKKIKLRKYGKHSVTKIKKVEKISSDSPLYEKYKYVYDVSMEENPHTFFANDILVHNSCYFRIMEAENIKEAEEIGNKVVEACDKNSIPMIVKEIFNGDDVMRSDFEKINVSTLSYGKKKQYAFLTAWKDGEVLAKPKLEITGLSIKRSDSPKQLSNEMKPFFIEIMKGISHNEIYDIMKKIESDYNKLSIYDLSAKRTANNLHKYTKAFFYEIKYKDRPFDIEKLYEAVQRKYGSKKIDISDKIIEEFLRVGEGRYSLKDNKKLVKDPNGELYAKAKQKMVVPFHIKASILYNYLLEKNGLENEYTPILDGDKIKVFYFKPIKLNIEYYDKDEDKTYSMIQTFDAIAFPSSTRKLPEFLNDFKIDRKKMLDVYFFNKLKTIFQIINFEKEKMDNQAINILF